MLTRTTELDTPRALAARVAGFGMHASETAAMQVPDAAWSAFLGTLVSQRLTGLAVAAAEAGWLQVSDGQARELLNRHRDAMHWALIVERKLLTLVPALEAAGIGIVVLKGPALAHTVYPDASWRPFSDLDLLVRTRDWKEATRVLNELGLKRRLPEPRPGFDESFGKAAAYADGDGVEVDLHRTLALGPFGLWIHTDELIERAVRFDLGGRTLRRLNGTCQMLHACVHASLGWSPPLLWTLRDVSQCARFAGVDWRDAALLTDRWRLRSVVRHAFQTTKAELRVEVPEAAVSLSARRPSRPERWALEAYTSGRRRRGGIALAMLRAVPGLRQKVVYASALIAPRREFMVARAGSAGWRSYLRRWKILGGWLRR